MNNRYQALAANISARFGDVLEQEGTAGVPSQQTVIVPKEKLQEVCQVLRDDSDFAFEILIDVAALTTWATGTASGKLVALRIAGLVVA